jgi:hypothetical protein
MIDLLRRYVAQLLDDGASEHSTLGRFKQWLRMGALLREDVTGWFEAIKRLQTLDQALAVLGCDTLDPASRSSPEP